MTSSSMRVVARFASEIPRRDWCPCWLDGKPTVLDLARTAGGEYLVGGYSTSRNRASALTASLVVPPGHPKLSCARLRSTWLLSHLIEGTRLPELASAAGLRGITVLSDLLAQCPTDGRAGFRSDVAWRQPVSRAPLDLSGGRPTSGSELNIARQVIIRSGVVDALNPLVDSGIGRPRHLSLLGLLVACQLNALGSPPSGPPG